VGLRAPPAKSLFEKQHLILARPKAASKRVAQTSERHFSNNLQGLIALVYRNDKHSIFQFVGGLWLDLL
jgi:hypothetical protein